MLPQFGSPSGGTHRPLNSYALVFDGPGGRRALLFDAPLRHALPGVRGLREEGVEIVGCVLSHADLAGSGDAFDILTAEFGIPLFLHPEDRHDPRAQGVMQEWADPTAPGAFGDLPIEILHWPGHSPGSIMLFTPRFGGVLLTGDSAIAPGPMQPDDAPPLARPPRPAAALLAHGRGGEGPLAGAAGPLGGGRRRPPHPRPAARGDLSGPRRRAGPRPRPAGGRPDGTRGATNGLETASIPTRSVSERAGTARVRYADASGSCGGTVLKLPDRRR